MILVILICLLTPQFELSVYGISQEPKPAAQTQVNVAKLKQQAEELTAAMINGDYEHAADLTYPELVKLMGGRTQYVAKVERAMKETQSEQFRILSATVGEPRDIEPIDGNHYAIVPTTIRIKVPDGTLIGTGFMVGISADGGKNWTFVDSAAREDGKAKIRALLGPVADKLRIPEYRRPVLIANPVNKPGRH